MNYVRIAQVLFWGVTLFLISPSKAAAVAYAIVIGGLFIATLIVVGAVRSILKFITRMFE